MRFFVTKEVQSNRLLVWVLALSWVFFAGLWVTNLLLYAKVGFTPAAIERYYLGSPDEFIPARTYLGMLEEAHFHFFAMGMLLVTLGHLVLFCPLSAALKKIILAGFTLGALGDILGGLGIVYLSPGFVYIKLACFWMLQGSIVSMLACIAWFLARPPSNSNGPPT